jgi:hypothetical protein
VDQEMAKTPHSYNGIRLLEDVPSDFPGRRIIPKGTTGVIVEAYTDPEMYAVDLSIPDENLVGGFTYENVMLERDQFELLD